MSETDNDAKIHKQIQKMTNEMDEYMLIEILIQIFLLILTLQKVEIDTNF